MSDTTTLTPLVNVAWLIYCSETAGNMDVKDFWWELSTEVQGLYLKKAADRLYKN